MALTGQRRGGLGAWIVDQRLPPVRESKWTQGDLAAALKSLRSGVKWNRTKVADLERGARGLDDLDADERTDLERVLGTLPVFDSEPARDWAALIAVLERQTEAITQLANAVRDSNGTQTGAVRAQGQIVGLLARILAPPGTPAERQLLQALEASGMAPGA